MLLAFPAALFFVPWTTTRSLHLCKVTATRSLSRCDMPVENEAAVIILHWSKQRFMVYQVFEVCVSHRWRQSKWAADRMNKWPWWFESSLHASFGSWKDADTWYLSWLTFLKIYGVFWLEVLNIVGFNCSNASRELDRKLQKHTRQNFAIKSRDTNSSWIETKCPCSCQWLSPTMTNKRMRSLALPLVRH